MGLILRLVEAFYSCCYCTLLLCNSYIVIRTSTILILLPLAAATPTYPHTSYTKSNGSQRHVFVGIDASCVCDLISSWDKKYLARMNLQRHYHKNPYDTNTPTPGCMLLQYSYIPIRIHTKTATVHSDTFLYRRFLCL